jgi:hypothetical protein
MTKEAPPEQLLVITRAMLGVQTFLDPDSGS